MTLTLQEGKAVFSRHGERRVCVCARMPYTRMKVCFLSSLGLQVSVLVCLTGSLCNLYSNLSARTLPVSLNLHFCPEERKNVDSRRHFAPGLNRNFECRIPKSGFSSFNFTYEYQLDEGTKKNVFFRTSCFRTGCWYPFPLRPGLEPQWRLWTSKIWLLFI